MRTESWLKGSTSRRRCWLSNRCDWFGSLPPGKARLRRLMEGFSRAVRASATTYGGGLRGLAREDTAEMARGGSKKRRPRRRIPRGRFLLRWLAVGVVLFIAFLYSQPLRSYISTRDALAERTTEVRELRAKKQRLERRLAEGDTPAAVEREARRLGYVKPGERLFIVKGIVSWRRTHERNGER